MEMLKKITPKDWLYIGGAAASLIALAWLMGSRTNIGSGTLTDMPNSTAPDLSTGGGSPGYTNYNFPPVTPTPLADGNAPDQSPAGPCGCNSPSSMGCAGPSQLDNGGAYSGNNQLYAFLDSISPNYAALQKEQLQTYAEYFAAGSTYDTGAGTVSGMLH